MCRGGVASILYDTLYNYLGINTSEDSLLHDLKMAASSITKIYLKPCYPKVFIMAGLKYYERTKYLIELIEKKKTGSPDELAGKIGVTKRMVYHILDDLRLCLEQEISYSKQDKSYVFSEKS